WEQLEKAQKALIKGNAEPSKVEAAIGRIEKKLEQIQKERIDAQTPPKADVPKLRGLPEGKRVALVVGINGYKSLDKLVTARNDADGIGATLKKKGFAVIEAYDVDRKGFFEKWQQFLEEVEPGAGTAAFFFAGHGIQIPNGKMYSNYLLPAD